MLICATASPWLMRMNTSCPVPILRQTSTLAGRGPNAGCTPACSASFVIVAFRRAASSSAPRRHGAWIAGSYLGALYGIYAKSDGFLALAMGSLHCSNCPALPAYTVSTSAFDGRDGIKGLLEAHLRQNRTALRLERLEAGGYLAAHVFTWRQLVEHPAFDALDMLDQLLRARMTPMYKLAEQIHKSCHLRAQRPPWPVILEDAQREAERKKIRLC